MPYCTQHPKQQGLPDNSPSYKSVTAGLRAISSLQLTGEFRWPWTLLEAVSSCVAAELDRLHREGEKEVKVASTASRRHTT